VQQSPHCELSHPGPGRPAAHLLDPVTGVGVAVAAAQIAQRVENVHVQRPVRVRQTGGPDPGVEKDGERAVDVTGGFVEKGQTASRDALPARVADLAGAGERLLQGDGRGGDVNLGQQDLAEQRLRPGDERQPVVALRQDDGRT